MMALPGISCDKGSLAYCLVFQRHMAMVDHRNLNRIFFFVEKYETSPRLVANLRAATPRQTGGLRQTMDFVVHGYPLTLVEA